MLAGEADDLDAVDGFTADDCGLKLLDTRECPRLPDQSDINSRERAATEFVTELLHRGAVSLGRDGPTVSARRLDAAWRMSGSSFGGGRKKRGASISPGLQSPISAASETGRWVNRTHLRHIYPHLYDFVQLRARCCVHPKLLSI
jgi:hypothetical protein